MAGNRRGFIGIFSPNTDNPDSESEEDLELEKAESSSEPAKNAGKSGRNKKSASKPESDWDDVFGEAPRQRSASGSIGAMLNSSPALKKNEAESANKPANKPAEKSDGGRGNASPASKSPKKSDAIDDTNSEADGDLNQASSFESAGETSSAVHHTHQPNHSTDNLSAATIMNDHPSSKSALSASDRLAINDAIQTLREKLSFARPNADDTPGATMQLGTTGRDFVDKALNAVQQNSDTLPRSFDDERFADDVELAKTLRTIGRDLDSLQKVVTDTEAKISTGTFLGALVVHGTGKIDSEALSKDAYRRGGETQASKRDLNSMAMAGETAGAV